MGTLLQLFRDLYQYILSATVIVVMIAFFLLWHRRANRRNRDE